MTIATTDSVTPIFAGNDVATSFPFTNFKVTINTDLEVYYVDAAGAEVLQTEGVDYTLVLNSDQDSSPGGTITYPISGSPLATGDKLYGKRAVQNIQTMDLANQSKYNPEVVEDAADKSVQQIQQLKEELSRAVKVTIGSEDDPDALIASIETSESNAAASAAAASASEAVTAADAVDTAADAVDTAADVTYTAEWANKAEDTLVSAAAGGDQVDDFSSLHHANKAAASAALAAANKQNIPARNTALTKDALSQAGSSTPGFSTVLATADDGITGTQYLRWQKDKNNIENWYMSDSVRGDFYLSSNLTAAEVATVPAINADDVSFQWDLISTITGLTNRNKSYTTHYNPYLGVSVVGYEGDGVDGHEIPHHLGKIPDLIIFKDRDTVSNWIIKSPLFATDEALYLETTAALATVAASNSIITDATISLDTDADYNASTKNIIVYNFASVPGVSKVDKYIGTGAAGNNVDCGFKPAFVMLKNLNQASNWHIIDSIRGDNNLFPNLTNVEGSADYIDFTDTGFVFKSASENVLNNEYIFLAFAETSIDANKAVTNYTLPTNADQLAIANPTLMTFANGFNANGQVDVQEQIAGTTLTYGATHEDKKYYIYRDNDSAWGQSEVRPLIGLTRNTADYSGVVSPSDSSLRTTALHTDYESETGTALASGENGASYAHRAFNKDSNDILSDNEAWRIAATTTSWLQYKFKEKRILKSWRLRELADQTETPDRFTIEGSDDGLTWTEVDATYKVTTGVAFDTVTNGGALWSPLQAIANTTAYLYYRINITENNGDATYTAIAELEFNTKIASDYYLVDEAKMYNDAGTRLDRVYIGEALLDSGGDVVSFINYAAGKQQLNEIEVHGKSVFHDDALGKMFATAWVNFDGTLNPPLMLDSFNVKDIVDLGTGYYKVIFDEPMDKLRYIYSGAAFNNNDLLLGSSSYDDATLNSLTFKVYSTGTALTDAKVGLTIFGGKEIK